jgi:5-bromo-4-chloroindolyl phosphate hydrolysis protein
MTQFGLGSANELAGQLGVAVLVFFCMIILGSIMLLYIRGENHKWEKREEMQASTYRSIIEQVTLSQSKDFDLLKQTLSDNREQIQIITRLVDRIKTMQEQSETAFRDLFALQNNHTQNPCYQKLVIQKQ